MRRTSLKQEMPRTFTVSVSLGVQLERGFVAGCMGWANSTVSLWHVAVDQSSLHSGGASRVGVGAPGCVSGNCLSRSQLLWVTPSLLGGRDVEAAPAATT